MTRATLMVFLAAGCPSAASGQELFQVHYSWLEVNAGTITPATGPFAGNSIVDSGEGARLRVGVSALINGASAVGQTTAYSTPSPGGIGTVRGLGSAVYDFLGDNAAPSAQGAWRWLAHGGAPWAIGNSPPMTFAAGAGVLIGGAQFVVPGMSANPVNNNQAIFSGVWTPASYAHRVVNWRAWSSQSVPAGEDNSILFSYGIGTGSASTGEPFNYDLIAGKYIDTDFGQGLHIPIAPAPASFAALGLLAAGSRRRPIPRRNHA
jgi:hypothetical protein